MDKVYNPETKRYVKRDSKKGIEILFKNKDKEILKSFELVKGNIIKKCPNGKIRNPNTLRCVNKKVNKKSNSLSRKRNAINKIKKAFSPFVKKASVDIYTRARYMMMMKRELKNVLKDGDGCLRIYKENPNRTFKYQIGSNIILNKMIGSHHLYSETYLSEFRDKSKKLLKFVSRISRYNNKKTPKELEILKLLTNIVRIGKCPHFQLNYGYVICDNFEKDIEENYENYPNIFKNIYKKYISLKSSSPYVESKTLSSVSSISSSGGSSSFNKEMPKLITLFNELTTGNASDFMITYQNYENNTQLFLNSFVQIILSIIFFNYHTDMIHDATYLEKFLFHKIKKGGYFHYKIFDEDFYVENLGFLWMISNFDVAVPIKEKIEENASYGCYHDFYKCILSFLPEYKINKTDYLTGFNELIKKENKDNMKEFFSILYRLLTKYMIRQESEFTYQNLMNFIKGLVQYFKKNQLLLTKIPSGEKIINKEPYVIGKDFLSRY